MKDPSAKEFFKKPKQQLKLEKDLRAAMDWIKEVRGGATQGEGASGVVHPSPPAATDTDGKVKGKAKLKRVGNAMKIVGIMRPSPSRNGSVDFAWSPSTRLVAEKAYISGLLLLR